MMLFLDGKKTCKYNMFHEMASALLLVFYTFQALLLTREHPCTLRVPTPLLASLERWAPRPTASVPDWGFLAKANSLRSFALLGLRPRGFFAMCWRGHYPFFSEISAHSVQ